MGCQGLIKSYSDENAYISTQELTLGFSFHSVSTLEANFYRLMHEGYFNDVSYHSLKDSLSLPNQVDLLLKNLSVKEGVYDGKKLLLYAILLGKGGEGEKGLALWNWLGAGNHITPSELETLLGDLFSLSLILPLDFTLPTEKITQEKLSIYLQLNSSKLLKACKTVCLQFPWVEGRLARQAFLECVQTKIATICTTRALRVTLEETPIMPQKFAAAFQPSTGFQSKLQ
jgi:hypothetical protein